MDFRCLRKFQEKSQKIRAPEYSLGKKCGQRGPEGPQAPYWRDLPPGRAGRPPGGGVPPPLVPYLAPYFDPSRGNPRIGATFRSTSQSRRHPLFFSGRANLDAVLASDE